MRLLEAEDHRVRLTYGRQALSELEEARAGQDAVLLIWSPNARSQTYMLEWAHSIPPSRLAEIAQGTHDCPPMKRLAAVVDFTNWRGQRGARAWKALVERLNTIAGGLGPMRVPTKAIAAVSFAGVAAVASGMMLRPADIERQITPVPLEDIATNDLGLRGALGLTTAG